MYEHYIGLDWAQTNMAIARMTAISEKVVVIDVPADISELKLYLSRLKGKKILVFEETTTSQWLYTELKGYVDEVVVCDPYRNRLLSEGPKTDKIDAVKLVQLLRAGMVKKVFHSGDEFIYLRKLVSGYEDLIKAGVRLKNQRSALFRGRGRGKEESELADASEAFVLQGIDAGIKRYEEERVRYEKEFHRLCKKHKMISNLQSIGGIGEIGAVKIAAIVVDANRFETKGKYLSYSGLVRLEKISGGRSYGSKNPRYSRQLKAVFKIGALAVIGEYSKSPLKSYYAFLIREKGYPEHQARHAVARRIALFTFGVMKSGKRFELRGALAK
jgi:transposase